MVELLGDVHLPIVLDKIKNTMEDITSNYGSFSKNLQLLQQAIVANISLVSSGSNATQPHIG